MVSYVVQYRAIKGTLIGGVTDSQSSRFASYCDAVVYAENVILAMQRHNVEVRIVISHKIPELFRHTSPSPDGNGWHTCTIGVTCVGATCSCGDVLTKEHAKASACNVACALGKWANWVR